MTISLINMGVTDEDDDEFSPVCDCKGIGCQSCHPEEYDD